MIFRVSGILAILSSFIFSAAVCGENLYTKESYESLISDNRAYRPGDLVTILVIESAEARAAAQSSENGSAGLGADFFDTNRSETLGLSANVAASDLVAVERSGDLRAQLSAMISRVSKEGLLYIEGRQRIEVDGREQTIQVSGWIRGEDIEPGNVVLSTRMTDADISYVGTKRSGRGVLTRFFSWFF